jgi:hypothetical protein
MHTITINLYKFNELSDDVKKRVIDRNRHINLEHGWWDNVYDDAENIGIRIANFDLDRRSIGVELLMSEIGIAEKILSEHGDSCETYKLAEKFINDCNSNDDDEVVDQLADDFRDAIADEYLSILRREEEYLSSDDAISNQLIISDIDFVADGRAY